ncbi:MAG: cupin domain-containing protein [Pseudomonadota bacterium]
MLSWPENISQQDFLGRYWQRRPLVMPGAVTGIAALTPDELAGLACEDDVESRIVLEKDGQYPWEVRHGPFAEDDFGQLPQSHWTLLVQDVDKHLPEVGRLLEDFQFLPRWRIDDIMVSYAAHGGSVGPHTDSYDVFLIQTLGTRRWRIQSQGVGEEDFVEGADLRILKDFTADHEWLLKPGDVLYLPPHLAHWGVAEGDCMTWSVGFRAPTAHELAAAWIEGRLEACADREYRDPDLAVPEHPARLSDAAVARCRAMVAELADPHDEAFDAWLCRHLSEPKPHLVPLVDAPEESTPATPRKQQPSPEKIQVLVPRAASRFLYRETGTAVIFAVDGQVHRLALPLLPLVRLICDGRAIRKNALASWEQNEQAVRLLEDLLAAGHLEADPGYPMG